MQYRSMPKSLKENLLCDIFNAALSAVHPHHAVTRSVRRENNELHVAGSMYALDSFDRVVVVGAGTAAARMAAAVEEVLGDTIDTGTVLVQYGNAAALRTIEQREAAAPIPDEAGIEGTRQILELLSGVNARTLVICLLSAGASSLLVSPLPGITLEDKQKSIDLLRRTGASVGQQSTVWKHLSGVKGGRLARAAYPATVLTLTLSDVVGDRIDVIGSGPMAPGNSTFCEAASLVEKLGLRYKLPERVTALIERGTSGQEPETPKSVEPCFRKTRNIIVGGMAQALFSARAWAEAAGYATDFMINEKSGSVNRTAAVLAHKAVRTRSSLNPGERRCLLFAADSPETGTARTGRNQELALAFAHEISGIPGITLLAGCTDGTDGVTDAAGAIVDGRTTGHARAGGIHTGTYLDGHDAAAFFRRLDSCCGFNHRVKMGPTGANRIDVQMILVEDESGSAPPQPSKAAAVQLSRRRPERPMEELI